MTEEVEVQRLDRSAADFSKDIAQLRGKKLGALVAALAGRHEGEGEWLVVHSRLCR